MIQGLLIKQLMKVLMPILADHLAPMKKYVFEDNELDVKCRELEQKLTDQGHKMTTLIDMIKARDEAIDKLEEFEKQVRRKKAFKRKDGE